MCSNKMQPHILITNGDDNGGVHSPEKWAQATVGELFDIAEGAQGALVADARSLREKFLVILAAGHARVQRNARDGILGSAPSLHCRSRADAVVDQLVEAARGTSFEAHFAEPAVRASLHKIVRAHMRHAMHVEHDWHEHRLAGTAHDEHMALFGSVVNPSARLAKES